MDWLALLLRAAGRRWWLAALVFLLSFAGAVFYFVRKPPVYRVEAKILVQRAQALPSVVRSMFEDAPGRSAWELVHRRENLIAIIEQAKLLEGAPAPTPAQPSGWRSLLARGQARAQPDPQDPEAARLDRMVLYLDRNLLVGAEEGTITLGLDWSDPVQAYRVVQVTLDNFIAARHQQEVTAIEEVISILQGHTNAARKDLDLAEENARLRRPRVARAQAPVARQPSDEQVRLKVQLEAKRKAIQDIEDLRRRRLAELLGQLDQARNTYSDAHPAVVELRQQVEAYQHESPQVEALRREEAELRRQWAGLMARDGGTGGDPIPAVAQALPVEPPDPDREDQGVRDARIQYEQLNARLSAAQLELDAARSAFKYRYKVIWPPQVPREPFSPNPKKILGAGALASLLLALLAAAAPDLLRGRIVERWQVERSLGLPVLGEFGKPR